MAILIGWEVQELPKCLAAGTFTPFLGSGASSLRSHDKINFEVNPWNNVGKTLATIYAKVATAESRHFLLCFVKERLLAKEEQPKEEQLTKLIELMTGAPPESADESLNLIDLQVALVRAMRRLTAIFGDEFAKQVPSLQELPDCAVSFKMNEEDEQEAWKILCEAAAIAKKLRDRKEQEPDFRGADAQWLPLNARRSFSVARVYDRLVVLTRLLVSEGDEKFVKSHCRDRFRDNPDLSSLGDALIEAKVLRGTLRLDMMQWLGDLLEYSLVYWIPRFPTTLELAFELSLAVPSGPPRRPDLAQAAQALDAIDPEATITGDYIKELLEYCESGLKNGTGEPVYRRFYVAIAAALCDQWAHYDDVRERAGRVDRRTAEADKYRQHSEAQTNRAEAAVAPSIEVPPLMPIIATTNYDRGLELVFEEFKINYHVLFPIQGSPGAVVPWVFRSVWSAEEYDDAEMSSSDADLPCAPDKLHGPVIVKLHGAPTLPKHSDTHSESEKLRHKIVVSEKEYLDALQESSSAFNWFEAEMFKPFAASAPKNKPAVKNEQASRTRTIWFLGYSIADWNVRLRLLFHLRGTPPDKRSRTRRAVNRDHDTFRHSILEELNVDLCHGDLTKVTDAIFGYLNTRYHTSSPAVQELVRELRRSR